MAEPARASPPRPDGQGQRPASPEQPPVERSIKELMAVRMQDFAGLSGEEYLALTDEDLPTLSDLVPGLRMQDVPRVTRSELLALTDRDLPSLDDLAPPDLMEQEEVLRYNVVRARAGARSSSGDVRGRVQAALRHHSPGRARSGAGRRGSSPTCWSPSGWGITAGAPMRCGARARRRIS